MSILFRRIDSWLYQNKWGSYYMVSQSKKKSIFMSRWHVYNDEIKLGEYSFIRGGKVSAFKCNKCKKIIIDINQK